MDGEADQRATEPFNLMAEHGVLLVGNRLDVFKSRSAVIGVYTHARPDGRVFYVGKGTPRRARSICQRPKQHKDKIKKYGAQNIRITFYPCSSEQDAFSKEVLLIAHYRALGVPLLNLTDGGEGASGFKIPLEVVNKRRLAMQGRPKSEAHKEKLRQALLGRKLSSDHIEKIRTALQRPEVREKMLAGIRSARAKNRDNYKKKSTRELEALIARNKSKEMRAKVSAALKGRKRTPEHSAKLSAALKGKCSAAQLAHLHKLADKARGIGVPQEVIDRLQLAVKQARERRRAEKLL
jgi:hypothetical protein